VTTTLAHRYRSGEIHEFRAAGADFIYLVTAGAIFEADALTRKVLDLLGTHGEIDHDDLVRALVADGVAATDAEELVRELRLARAIESTQVVHALMPAAPPADYPLQALVFNVTNQCNLACTYCYEFGADKIATPAGKPKYMSLETAKSSVDFQLRSADRREAVHITFFGGETLMNFRLLREVVLYADEAAAAAGKRITYSLTTNATLLTDEIIAFLSDHAIGVTVSMDGPAELQDARRV